MKDNPLWRLLISDLKPTGLDGEILYPPLLEKYVQKNEGGYEWDEEALKAAPYIDLIELVAVTALYWKAAYQSAYWFLMGKDDLIDAEALLSKRMPDV